MSSVSKTDKTKDFFSLLLIFLVIKGIWACLTIVFSDMGLAPDEAQYWTWSQDLAWGYYSKPPGIAWQIYLTTLLFGNTLFGVRVGAVLFLFFLPLIIWKIARKLNLSPHVAFWGAIGFAFSPLGIFYSFVATTDIGAIFFLTLAALEVVRKPSPNYYLTGLWIFVGALFKWVVFVFWPILLFFLFFDKKFRRPSLMVGIVISLLAFIPTFLWNATHDFATFKHVYFTLFNPKTSHGRGNFFDFLGAQLGLLSPVFFILLILSLIVVFAKGGRRKMLIGAFPLVSLFYFLLAAFKKIQPNWALYLYPPGFALLGVYPIVYKPKGKFWLHIGLWVSIVGSYFAILIPTFQTHDLLPIPYKINPFRQTLGWNKLDAALTKSGYDPNKDFLFSDKYQMTSLLSFYGPEQKRGYFFNLGGSRKNQFSYWPGMETEVGKTGYFVIGENKKWETNWYKTHYEKMLRPYFENVEFILEESLFEAEGEMVKFAMIFRCTNYTGKEPLTPEKY